MRALWPLTSNLLVPPMLGTRGCPVFPESPNKPPFLAGVGQMLGHWFTQLLILGHNWGIRALGLPDWWTEAFPTLPFHHHIFFFFSVASCFLSLLIMPFSFFFFFLLPAFPSLLSMLFPPPLTQVSPTAPSRSLLLSGGKNLGGGFQDSTLKQQ